MFKIRCSQDTFSGLPDVRVIIAHALYDGDDVISHVRQTT